VAVCVVAAVLLLISGYAGYAGVLAAVGLAAAVNLV
jgi:hypothetical protein